MNYGLIYTIPFATLDNVSCVVEIEKENYSGTATELQAGSTPFVTDIEDDEFLYAPTRFSTAKMQVVGNDYLQSLFSTVYREYRVTLKKNDTVTWCGFIKPELYTQDYEAEIFILEIECISAMSVLDFIDYTIESEEKKFVSLWYLIKRCISTSYGKYNAVYIPYVYAESKGAYGLTENVLDKMMVSEQDFFDEDNKPMKMKEVLEEVCKFLNWTCVDWKGELYFVDVDHDGKCHKYDTGLLNKVDVLTNLLKVQDVGFAGTGHSLDILPGYNKASVKCSNYPIGEIVMEEDYENLPEIKTIDNEKSDKSQVCRSVYLSPKNWNLQLYDADGNIIQKDNLTNYKDVIHSLKGATLVKYCLYNQQKNGSGKWEPEITNYSFINAIRVIFTDKNPPYPAQIDVYGKAMMFKGASATYSDCAIAISGSVKAINNADMLPWRNSGALNKSEIACQIRIGNKYYGNPQGDDFTFDFNWSDNPKNFVTLKTESWNNDQSLDWIPIENRKKLSMPYDGLSGIIIPINEMMAGELDFSLFVATKSPTGNLGNIGLYIKDFKVVYQKKDGAKKENDNTDRTYENILNESYINELDEIEFKISSYNEDGACYSKVLLNGDYLRDNLYNIILDKTIRPEEMMIIRIINHYSATRIKLTQVIKSSDDITPLTKLSDTFLVGKRFINMGGSIDYKMNRFECIMIEI